MRLDRRILRAVKESGYEIPTDIQQRAIPVVLGGRDLLASAHTGSGKTAAFALPALDRLATATKDPERAPVVLVLTPTRELATQVYNAFRQYGKYLQVSSTVIIGGESGARQASLLRLGPQIVVGTPGRLNDHIRAGRLRLGSVGMLVLDEADRMLELGLVDDVQAIAKACPEERQTLLFSATLEGEVAGIATSLMNKPLRVQVGGMRVRHRDILQKLFLADNKRHKLELLIRILRDPSLKQALIFTRTRNGAEALAAELAAWGVPSAALHGEKVQAERQQVVEDARSGALKIVVATDLGARGLDLRGVSHVVNFDLPEIPEIYIHRIGRTGRAGDAGVAISLVTPEDEPYWADIETLISLRLAPLVIPGLEPKRHSEETLARSRTLGKKGKAKANYERRFGKKPKQEPAKGKRSLDEDDEPGETIQSIDDSAPASGGDAETKGRAPRGKKPFRRYVAQKSDFRGDRKKKGKRPSGPTRPERGR